MKPNRLPPRRPGAPLFAGALLLAASPAWGQRYLDPAQDTYDDFLEAALFNENFFTTSNTFVLLAAALTFIMHLGFTTLETGLTRSKNAVNVLYKNLYVLTSGILVYVFCGYRTMYPGAEFDGFLRFGFGIGAPLGGYFDLMTPLHGELSWWTHVLFQAMFAATVATIVSGAVAERIKLTAFMLFVPLLVGVAYPVCGSWIWEGAGWLARHGFKDFAGATLVHAFGGSAALACVLLLGPRRGRYVDGQIKAMPGHNLPLATIGAFLLWFGWFGFNGGTVLSAHPDRLPMVVLNTLLGGAAGGLAALLLTQFAFRRADLTMVLNGVLGGLVGVTGTADSVLADGALAAGAIGGVLVVLAIPLLDRLRVDDPIGAISVHGVGGAWGTLAVGIFGQGILLWQAIGLLVVALTAFLFSFGVFGLIRLTLGVRVGEEEERQGLDLSEHQQEAYAPER